MTLEERLNAAIAAQQAIVTGSRAAGNTELTEAEQRDFDSQQSIIDDLRAQIADQERADAEARARTAERQRINDITALCREFNIPDAELRSYVEDGDMTIERAREKVLSYLRNNRLPADAGVSNDEIDKFRAAAADGLCLRAGVQLENPAAGANEYRSMSLRDLAIESLVREGNGNDSALRRMDVTDLLRQFFNPTSSFPAILDSSINKSIVKLYQSVPTTFQAWTQRGTLHDFKTTSDHEYAIGGAGEFKKVLENGELEHDKPSDALLPSRKLDTYGRQFSMSRQAFINDDIGFLTEVPGLYAASAKKTIDRQVYSLIFNNSTIFDGKTLFHADHNNLITSGAAPSQSTIQAAILKMQKQSDQFGEPITMVPAFLVVPVGYEFDLAVVFGSTQLTGSSNNDINPLYNYPLKVVQTPVLNGLAGANACPWFLVSDPMSAKSIQVDYLNGQDTPTIRRMETAGTLGFTWDIYLDWGINVRDFRGILKNPGAVV